MRRSCSSWVALGWHLIRRHSKQKFIACFIWSVLEIGLVDQCRWYLSWYLPTLHNTPYYVHVHCIFVGGGVMSATSSRASAMSCLVLLVDLRPLRFLCMCPLAVAVDDGRCLSKDGTKPGKESSRALLTALRRVTTGGENND